MNKHSHCPSHLFTLRLWKEPMGDDVIELRFHVQCVLTGESRIFRDDKQIVAYLLAKIEETEQEQS